MEDLHRRTATELLSLIRSRQVPAVEAARSCLDRIESLDPKLLAFREDRVVPSVPVSEALANAPETSEGHFTVPRVIG